MRGTAKARLGAWILATSLSVVTCGAGPARIHWQHDYAAAAAEATSLTRPMLLYFTAKWCPACLRVERGVFSDPRVAHTIAHQFVALRIDADAAPELAEHWRVERFPTAILVARDGTGTRLEGFRPADQYLADLTAFLKRNQQQHAIAESTTSVQPAHHTAAEHTIQLHEIQRPQAEQAESGIMPASGVAQRLSHRPRPEILLSLQQETNLALDGACVVSMMDGRKIIAGDPDMAVEFDGSTYWFAGFQQREKFRTAPVRYVPVLKGMCVVSFVEDGDAALGSVRHAAIYRGRLYLFASSQQRHRFQANPARYHSAIGFGPQTP